jgi:hypothetical protein
MQTFDAVRFRYYHMHVVIRLIYRPDLSRRTSDRDGSGMHSPYLHA